jgi:hypothetical protein
VFSAWKCQTGSGKLLFTSSVHYGSLTKTENVLRNYGRRSRIASHESIVPPRHMRQPSIRREVRGVKSADNWRGKYGLCKLSVQDDKVDVLAPWVFFFMRLVLYRWHWMSPRVEKLVTFRIVSFIMETVKYCINNLDSCPIVTINGDTNSNINKHWIQDLDVPIATDRETSNSLVYFLINIL